MSSNYLQICPCGTPPCSDTTIMLNGKAVQPYDALIETVDAGRDKKNQVFELHWKLLRASSDEWNSIYLSNKANGVLPAAKGVTARALSVFRHFLYKGCLSESTSSQSLDVLIDELLPLCYAYNIASLAAHIKHDLKSRVNPDTFLRIAKACIVISRSPQSGPAMIYMPSVFRVCVEFLANNKQHEGWMKEVQSDTSLFHHMSHELERLKAPPPPNLSHLPPMLRSCRTSSRRSSSNVTMVRRPIHTSTPASSVILPPPINGNHPPMVNENLNRDRLLRMSNEYVQGNERYDTTAVTDESLTSAHGLTVTAGTPIVKNKKNNEEHLTQAEFDLALFAEFDVDIPEAYIPRDLIRRNRDPPRPKLMPLDFGRPISPPVRPRPVTPPPRYELLCPKREFAFGTKVPEYGADALTEPPLPTAPIPPRTGRECPMPAIDGSDIRHCLPFELARRYPKEGHPSLDAWGQQHYTSDKYTFWTSLSSNYGTPRETRMHYLCREIMFDSTYKHMQWIVFCKSDDEADLMAVAFNENFKAPGGCAVSLSNRPNSHAHPDKEDKCDALSREAKIKAWTNSELQFLCRFYDLHFILLPGVVDGSIRRNDPLLNTGTKDAPLTGIVHMVVPANKAIYFKRLAVYEINGTETDTYAIWAAPNDVHISWQDYHPGNFSVGTTKVQEEIITELTLLP